MDPPLTGWIFNFILSDREGEGEVRLFGITLASLLGGSEEFMMGRRIT